MKYYLIGIKGAGVSALALILKDLGHEVIGYDDTKTHEFTEDKLIERGITYYIGKPNPSLDNETIVVRSSAIKDEHPEIVRAKELELKIYDLFEYIGKLTNDYETISIAGCHGKTTTTAMLTSIMDKQFNINYYIGDGRGKANPDNKIFVAEACEYKRHFMNYNSDITVVTNIDNDHLDYFKDIEDIKNSFEEFLNTTKQQVIACGDDINVRDLKINVPVLYYGLNKNNDIVAENVSYKNGIKFDCYVKNKLYGNIDVPIYGEHNLLNILAVVGICYLYNINTDLINEQLKNYNGAARRFSETIIGDNIIVDDYAHHSTEVLVTVKTAKQKYPDKNIVAIFEPHSFNRVVDLHQEFSKALSLADKAYVLPIYPSRDNPADYPDITSEMILKDIPNSELLTEDKANILFEYTNTVFLFMSLKEIHKIKDDLINYLNNDK